MRELLLSRNKDARAISMVCGAPRASSFPSSDRRERRDQTVRCWRGKRGAEQARCVRAQAKRVITYGAIKNEESYTLELTEENVETVLDEVKRKKKKRFYLSFTVASCGSHCFFFLSFFSGRLFWQEIFNTSTDTLDSSTRPYTSTELRSVHI